MDPASSASWRSGMTKMCGIISYIGKQEALPILLDGLRRLEYRGYDSAGVAILDPRGKLRSYRAAGRVADLEESLGQKSIAGTVGIAHTRWATHGKPSVQNAHPHLDCTGTVAVVHNGIIENHAHLREALLREGHVFSSDTDSEVLSHLIERSLSRTKTPPPLAEAVTEALLHVQGTYGIAVTSAHHPDSIVAARRGSPLLIGVGEGAFFAASDSAALVQHTRQIIYLDDNELGILSPQGYEVCNLKRKRVAKPIETVTGTIEEVQKGGFDHFMAKEIHEAPEVIRNALRGRVLFQEGTAKFQALDDASNRLHGISRIIIPSCGTSYYAGIVGKYVIEELAGIPVETVHASEFRYAAPPLDRHALVIAVSQSGETADTLEALREAKRKGAQTLAIVNVVGSTIAREAGMGIYNHAGPEIGVASTKSFISQLAVLVLLGLWFGRWRHVSLLYGRRLLQEFSRLPQKAEQTLAAAPQVAALARVYARHEHFLYLGRKYNWPTALEGALKLKEISYAHAEGYAAGEMKHGPIALIDKAFPSVVIALSDSVYEKSVSSIQEIKARGGNVLAIATEGNKEISSLADHILYVPRTLECLSPMLAVIPLQLFAYYVARERECDIDKPRNLAKSVTVE